MKNLPPRRWWFAAMVVFLLAGTSTTCAHAPANPATPAPPVDSSLARHDFLYCGEWQTDRPGEHIYLVRGGKVVWSHEIPDKEELGDCTMTSTGHVLFVRKQHGAAEILPDLATGKGGQITWSYPGAPGTEVHSVQPIGLDKVLVMQNGQPAKLMLITKATGEMTVWELPSTKNVHAQYRHVRMTAAGTFMVAHLSMGIVREYDRDAKTVLWQFDDARSAWAAVRLKNGNTLVSGNQNGWVREVSPDKKIVWELTQKDVDFQLYTLQEAMRLANGNTIINYWVPNGLKDKSLWPSTVQVFEVTPDKKVVWKLQAWKDPSLGPASCTQILDEPGVPEKPGDVQR